MFVTELGEFFMDYSNIPNKNLYRYEVLLLQLRSYVEGLEPIAVIGNLQQPGSVVLAASPAMKEKFKIKQTIKFKTVGRKHK